jgi:hypothetical protein
MVFDLVAGCLPKPADTNIIHQFKFVNTKITLLFKKVHKVLIYRRLGFSNIAFLAKFFNAFRQDSQT